MCGDLCRQHAYVFGSFRHPLHGDFVVPPLRVLLVEPRTALRATLEAAASPYAQIDACPSFSAARGCLKTAAYNLLVTALRLSEYNGLHLVYLANVTRSGSPLRAIVYDEEPDPSVAAEVQRAGAFYEIAPRIVVTLPAFVPANLPEADRRAPAMFDRRRSVRGGRRLWDRSVLAAGASSLLVRPQLLE